jgi:hypothetical protein
MVALKTGVISISSFIGVIDAIISGKCRTKSFNDISRVDFFIKHTVDDKSCNCSLGLTHPDSYRENQKIKAPENLFTSWKFPAVFMNVVLTVLPSRLSTPAGRQEGEGSG